MLKAQGGITQSGNFLRHEPRGVRGQVAIFSRIRRFRGTGSEEGASLVETALALLILIPFLFGALEFCLMFYCYQGVTDAARRACRWASFRGSTSCTNTPSLTSCNAGQTEIQAYVSSLNYPAVDSSKLKVSTLQWLAASSGTPTSWSSCSGDPSNVVVISNCPKDPGNEAVITVSYDFPISIAYWKVTTIHLKSTGAAVISQ